MAEAPPVPEVFDDKMSKEIAPAAQGSATAKQAEAKNAYIKDIYVPSRLEDLTQAALHQPTEYAMTKRAVMAQEALTASGEEVGQATTELQAAQRKEDVVSGFRDRFSQALGLSDKRTTEQREEDIAAAEVKKAQAEADLEKAGKAQEAIKEAGETVHEHPPEYFAKQIRVLAHTLESIQRPDVPLEVSEKMRKALEYKDTLQTYVRELVANGYDTDPTKNLPVETFQRIKKRTTEETLQAKKLFKKSGGIAAIELPERLPDLNGISKRNFIEIPASREPSLYYRDAFDEKDLELAQKRAVKAGLALTTITEAAGNYAEQHGMLSNPAAKETFVNNMRVFTEKGATAFEKMNGNQTAELITFAREQYGTADTSLLDSPYVVGCYQLDKLFKEIGIPEGHDRIPYVMAFSAGLMSSYQIGASVNRQEGASIAPWLAETVPSAKRAQVVKKDDGKYDVEEITLDVAKPLGLGWTLKRQREIGRIDNHLKYGFHDSPFLSKEQIDRQSEEIDKLVTERNARSYDGTDAKGSAKNIIDGINASNEQRDLVGYEGYNDPDPRLDPGHWKIGMPQDYWQLGNEYKT